MSPAELTLATAPAAAESETHTGIVFFVGDRAYKLKKAVDLGFLDFTTREARERDCHREVELNRRFSPDVYLGVADVHGPSGELCDHLVVMRRMPGDRRLSTLVRAGSPMAAYALRAVARRLAAWHATAPRGEIISVSREAGTPCVSGGGPASTRSADFTDVLWTRPWPRRSRNAS